MKYDITGNLPYHQQEKDFDLMEVAVLVREHWGNEKLRQYLEALNPKDAVTGSVIGDKLKAAEINQGKSGEVWLSALTAQAKDAEVARCMQWALRPVLLSHNQRKAALKLAAQAFARRRSLKQGGWTFTRPAPTNERIRI